MIFIFDYDGTCYETLGIYGEAVREAEKWVNDKGYFASHSSEDSFLKKYLGLNADIMWEEFMPDAPEDIRRQGSLIVQESLIEGISLNRGGLYEGIPRLLEKLKAAGHVLLILSNCTIRYRDAHIKTYELDRWFSKFYCSEAFDGIPKEEIFRTLAEEYPGEYVMIGDRYSDMKVGYEQGFPAVACHYGYGSREELKDADFHVESVQELEELLLGTF
ncbi:MAG: HAD family hydrolase [Lentihominibacter sp.]